MTDMGWLPQSAFDDKRRAALALTREERKALTWEEARKFVVADTIDIARFSGLSKRTDITPWNAVCILRHIDRAEGDPYNEH